MAAYLMRCSVRLNIQCFAISLTATLGERQTINFLEGLGVTQQNKEPSCTVIANGCIVITTVYQPSLVNGNLVELDISI